LCGDCKIAAGEKLWVLTLSSLNRLNALLGPAVQSAGYRLVRLRIMGGKRKTLQIMAERPDGGMDVGDCAELSRKLSEVLEAADPIAEEFVLEVSSPGIDRPLVDAADFERFAGHEARIEMAHPIDGRRRFRGSIVGLHNGDVVMDTSSEQGQQRIMLPLPDIAEAKLVLTDRLIQESLKARDARASKQSAPEHPEPHRSN
jgi:ribosome maturation factor RimP